MIEWIRNNIYAFKRRQAVVDLVDRFKCRCGNDAYFHANIGAAILWCEDCGVIATQHMVRGTDKPLKQMTQEQYDKFVKGVENES